MIRIFTSFSTGVILLAAALVAPVSSGARKASCPPQMGQVVATIAAGELSAVVENPIDLCPNMNVQLSGGSSLQVPIILNARVHQGVLIITASLLHYEEGPVDVTVWWHVSFAD